MMFSTVRRTALLCAVVFLAACGDDITAPPSVAGIELTHRQIVMTSVGDTIRITATAVDDDRLSVAARIAWSSDQPAVATVDSNGVVIARGAGEAIITAQSEGVATTARVTVTPRAVSIQRVGQGGIWLVGDTGRIPTEVRDARGNVITSVRVHWTAPDSNGISVDSTGLLRILAVGILRVRVEAEGVSTVFSVIARDHLDSLSAGAASTCARGRLQDVYCWGAGFSNTTGYPFDQGRLQANPTRVVSSSGALKVKQLSAGRDHVCAVADNGGAYCWGGMYSAIAVRVGSQTFSRISAGNDFTCGVSTDRRLYCWGRNTAAQLISATPVQISSNADYSDVAAGDAHACAVRDPGTVVCWGSNRAGQLGIGRIDADVHAIPVDAVGTSALVNVSAGGDHTCAISNASTLFCWGSNHFGQVGNGGYTAPCVVGELASDCVTLPTAVALPAAVRNATTGAEHTCAVLVTDQAFCWGNGRNGRTGNRVTGDSAIPVALPYRWLRLNAGALHSCGFFTPADNSGLACFGSNAWGQLPFSWIGGEYSDPGGSSFHAPLTPPSSTID